jgi:hypothetical protein
MNNRLLIGGVIGAGLMYLMDSEKGAARRMQLQGFWADNQGTVDDARQFAGQAVGAVRPLGGRLGIDWGERPNAWSVAAAGLPALLAAGAVGAGIAYVLDSERGAERRAKLMGFVQERRQDAQQAVGQTVSQIRPHVQSFGPRIESIRVKAQNTALTAVRRGNGADGEPVIEPAGGQGGEVRTAPAGVAQDAAASAQAVATKARSRAPAAG